MEEDGWHLVLALLVMVVGVEAAGGLPGLDLDAAVAAAEGGEGDASAKQGTGE